MGQEAQDVIRSLKEDYAISSSLKQYAERYRVLSNLISPCSSFYPGPIALDNLLADTIQSISKASRFVR